jgi:hypothetical protein
VASSFVRSPNSVSVAARRTKVPMGVGGAKGSVSRGMSAYRGRNGSNVAAIEGRIDADA